MAGSVVNNYEPQRIFVHQTMSPGARWTVNWTTNFQHSMQAVQRAMENITIVDPNLDQERRDAHDATVPAWAEDALDPLPENRERG
jgi:hypothetical protein